MQKIAVGMILILENQGIADITFVGASISGSSTMTSLFLPQSLSTSATNTEVASVSLTDYSMNWVYSPDSGLTKLTFDVQIGVSEPDNPKFSISPSTTGPESNMWSLAEGPGDINLGNNYITFRYIYGKPA